jgi:hypothetical protein
MCEQTDPIGVNLHNQRLPTYQSSKTKVVQRVTTTPCTTNAKVTSEETKVGRRRSEALDGGE